MCVARVITDGESPEAIEIAERSGNETIADSSVPTLIIGKKRAERIYGKDRVKILDKHIEGNVYWTYARNERRDGYREGVEAFNKFVADMLLKNVRYCYFNPFRTSWRRVRELLLVLRDRNVPKCIYAYRNHLYMFVKGVVCGVDLREFEYMGIPARKVVSIMSSARNCIKVRNGEGFDVERLILDMGGVRYVVPYVYFLKNGVTY